MKHTKSRIKQRNQTKFQVKDGAYAVIRYKPFQTGKIMNISRDGLTVRYLSNGHPLNETSELDIFIIDSNYYIEKIRVNTISDFELTDKDGFGFNNIRQRSFEFGKMKSGQLFYLDYFLENFTEQNFPEKSKDK
jgi:hypothetical protein